MQILNTEEFFEWGKQHSLGISEQYPDSKTLSFNDSPDSWTAWTIEKDTEASSPLVAAIKSFGKQEFFWLYQKYGTWRYELDEPCDPIIRMIAQFFILKGLPTSFDGVIKVGANEQEDLLLFSFLQLLFCGSAATDVYLVGSDGAAMLLLGHHEELILSCENDETLKRYVETMKNFGYPND